MIHNNCSNKIIRCRDCRHYDEDREACKAYEPEAGLIFVDDGNSCHRCSKFTYKS